MQLQRLHRKPLSMPVRSQINGSREEFLVFPSPLRTTVKSFIPKDSDSPTLKNMFRPNPQQNFVSAAYPNRLLRSSWSSSQSKKSSTLTLQYKSTSQASPIRASPSHFANWR